MRELGTIAALVERRSGMPSRDLHSDQSRVSYRQAAVKALCGCYRKDEAADPAIYSAAIVAVLEEYPDDIVSMVTDPRTGLPSKCQWLPTVKEVKDACDYLVEQTSAAGRRQRDLDRQMVDRAQFEAEQNSKRERSPEEQARVDYQIDEWKRRKAAIAGEAANPRPVLDSTPFLLAEYEAAGVEPVYASDGRLISLELVQRIGVHKQDQQKIA